MHLATVTFFEPKIPENHKENMNHLSRTLFAGPDNIPPKLLKLVGDSIVPSLLSLFRLSLNTSRVFTSWKTARLTPVYKKDD